MSDGSASGEPGATTPPAPVTGDMAPGGPRAMANGCLCSVLANAAFRSGAMDEPCIDPRCPLHAGDGYAPAAR